MKLFTIRKEWLKMKTTKKELLSFAKNMNAEDITYNSFNETNKLLKNIIKKDVAFSVGIYGINAYLFMDEKTSKYYVITSRASVLFQVM